MGLIDKFTDIAKDAVKDATSEGGLVDKIENAAKDAAGKASDALDKASVEMDKAKEKNDIKKAENDIKKAEKSKKNKKLKAKKRQERLENVYIPETDSLKLALSALLTQDSDTKKLFEDGDQTGFKLFGGDINNFINLNSNLITAGILMKILEKLESIDAKLDNKKT